MKRPVRTLVLLLSLVLFSGAARAQWEGESTVESEGSEFMPLTLQDMSCRSKMELSLPLVPASEFLGFAPWLYLQYGTGSYSVGVTVPLAMVFPYSDEVDDEIVFGNLTFDIKGRIPGTE